MTRAWWRRTGGGRLLLLTAILFTDLGSPGHGHVRHRRSKSTYTIGLLVIVDYGLWRRWRAAANSESDAMRNIEYYFTHLIDKVNTRYMTLESPQYDMRVVLQGLHVAKTPSESPWTETLKKKSQDGREVVNASLALDELVVFTHRDSTTYQQYDHVMGFTGYDLYADQNGVINYGKIGSAILGGMCDAQRKVSLVEDRRDYTSVIPFAHEMAHNLNAIHDGDNRCNPAEQKIMSPVVETRGDSVVGQFPFTSFSTCTAEEIGDHILNLNSRSMNCMSDTPQPFTGSEEWQRNLQQLPGQMFDLDAQCSIVVEGASFYCGTDTEDICKAVVCRRGRECLRFHGNKAFDGTNCGPKKWCIEGACVEDEAAPDEACPFGDSGLAPCSLKNISYYCYTEQTRMLCCETCASIRDVTKRGCEYGDKHPDCARLSADLCSIPDNADACCKTCNNYLCPFGDTKPNCDASLDCGHIGTRLQCCKTCSQSTSKGQKTHASLLSVLIFMITTYALRSHIESG